MKDELAGRVLDLLLEWTIEEQSEWTTELRRLAALKYDEYEGFAPGERFFESLARWLGQFDDQADRRRLLEFIRRELVFVSSDELNHAISCAYPDNIKVALLDLVADQLGRPRYDVDALAATDEFRSLRRRTLYLGLSDGARLDRLRRSSSELSHEQFWLAPELGSYTIKSMANKLREAMEIQTLSGDCAFQYVVLVDDFYGSGTSLLRQEDGEWRGKLARAAEHLAQLQAPMEEVGDSPLLAAAAGVSILVYIASAQAELHIRQQLGAFRPEWRLHVIQRLPSELAVKDPHLVELCRQFFDPCLIDRHKERAVPLGYMDAALPLVLHHNTPNNSICPLWADSTDRPGCLNRHALFRRYERHHQDRP